MRRIQCGFTLIELIAATVLLGILALIGANMITDSFLTTRFLNKENESATSARYAMERMSREIRELDINSITTRQPTEFSFTRKGATVNLALRGGSLLLDSVPISANSPTLVSAVTSITFAYLDKTSAPTALASAVRIVEIDMTVTPANKEGRPIRLLNRIAIRNL